MKLSAARIKNFIIYAFGTFLLIVALVLVGFAACCLPFTTTLISNAVSTSENSPYTHEQLVKLAEMTRDYTVDFRTAETTAAARANLADTVVNFAREDAASGSAKGGEWTYAARAVLALDASSEETTERLARLSDRYALDEAALTHLDDVNRVVWDVLPGVLLLCLVAVVVFALLVKSKRWRLIADMLKSAPVVLFVKFGLLAGLALLDFNAFFAQFHRLFFAEGSWVFSADSLLITMYPLPFWMSMAGVWLVVSLLFGIVFFVGGIKLGRYAKKCEVAAK